MARVVEDVREKVIVHVGNQLRRRGIVGGVQAEANGTSHAYTLPLSNYKSEIPRWKPNQLVDVAVYLRHKPELAETATKPSTAPLQKHSPGVNTVDMPVELAIYLKPGIKRHVPVVPHSTAVPQRRNGFFSRL